MKAYVYLNDAPGHWDGFELTHADSLNLVLIADVPDDRHDLSVLDDLFTELNIGGTYLGIEEAYREKDLRSLSVGDVIVLGTGTDRSTWACERSGWSKLSNFIQVFPVQLTI